MKSLITLIILVFAMRICFAQETTQPNYGPVPFRTLEQTIGEYYVITPGWSSEMTDKDYSVENTQTHNHPLYKDLLDSKFKLMSIVGREKGLFKDDNGVEYVVNIVDNVKFIGLAPLKDLEMARELYLNKTLWIKNFRALTYSSSKQMYLDTLITTLKPVVVTKISAGRGVDPLVFTFKMPNGTTASYGIDLSGTNSHKRQELFIDNNFYLKDPHLIYHFTPVVWKQIENAETPIGMSSAAFELVKGKPDKINSSRTGNTIRQQWVYGETSPTYYYFTNDKYTGYN